MDVAVCKMTGTLQERSCADLPHKRSEGAELSPDPLAPAPIVPECITSNAYGVHFGSPSAAFAGFDVPTPITHVFVVLACEAEADQPVAVCAVIASTTFDEPVGAV